MTPSAFSAPARRLSRSPRSPRCTSAPAPTSASAEASERASPTTVWPARCSSGTTAEPMKPDAPVTNRRMSGPPGWMTGLMSVTVMDSSTRCQRLSSTRITGMSRWEPNAPARLAQAAMELFAEAGYEETTVARIAERAGLTERTFFRHFADKREVLFAGSSELEALFVDTVAAAPESAGPMQAVAAALEQASG